MYIQTVKANEKQNVSDGGVVAEFVLFFSSGCLWVMGLFLFFDLIDFCVVVQ